MEAWPETQIYGADGYGHLDRSALEDTHGSRRSFMDRARARPGLTIETTNPPTLEPSPFSPGSPEDDREFSTARSSGVITSRKDSVAVKSPLQKLEVALGDVSKEAKRAKLEEVEQAVERRRSRSKKTNSGYPPSNSTKKDSRAFSEESTALNVDRSRSKGQDDNAGSSSRPRTFAEDEKRFQGGDRGSQYGSIRFSRTNSQSRQQGYNAMLSGVAAAAAVNAYQFSHRHPSSPEDDSQEDLSAIHPAVRPLAANKVSRSVSQPVPSSRTAPVMPPFEQHPSMRAPKGPEQDLNRSRTTSGPYPIVQSSTMARGSTIPRKPVGVETGTQNGFHYKRVEGPALHEPQSLEEPEPPKRSVAFDNQDPTVIPAPATESKNRHRVSNPFSRHPIDVRKYQSSAPALDEWRQAGIAALTSKTLASDDSAPESEDKNVAWWERSSPQDAAKSQRNVRSSSAAQSNTRVTGTEGQTFEPSIYLKCGPLLRFTGIRKDTFHPFGGQTPAQFWYGSIMIVTEDARSKYHPPPRLRLFLQSRGLVEQHSDSQPASHNPGQSEEDYLAGEMKLSRTGQPVYVKPSALLPPSKDLSQTETESGLFTGKLPLRPDGTAIPSRLGEQDAERRGQFQEIQGTRLHAERGVTFWRFSLKIELATQELRIAYRINNGPAIGFWVPAKGQAMNIMFHSCNGFSLSANPDEFSGPDPLWRDVLTQHQSRPFHVMIGGGDQVYNDRAMTQTELFQEWLSIKNPERKHNTPFSKEMQEELEDFYLDRYAMWFSQGLFGMANSQIPMINMWDDHDIIDGFGSYPHHFMSSPVFTGVGAVAYKYYLLFQHQSVPEERTEHEPSWVLGPAPGPYIEQLSRSVFMSLGQGIAFLGLDCRTERMRDEILSQDTWDVVFDRCRRDILDGETRHLIVLLGVPIAYPRLNILENILTSRFMDPVKALGRAGMMGNLMNKFDGGVEILDDLDDHWTAKHHKHERNWFIEELQELAAEKSIRITILGGDVHLAAVGQFYSNKKLGIPKDHDHRYMPNIVSSAIVNTPPPEMMADILNKRNKVHHLNSQTDEYMIPLFTHDVNGKPRNNKNLLPRRNWCSIRDYAPGSTPPPTPPASEYEVPPSRSSSRSRSSSITRTFSFKGNLVRKLSRKRSVNNPPSSFRTPNEAAQQSSYSVQSDLPPNTKTYFDEEHRYPGDARHSFDGAQNADLGSNPSLQRSDSFRRRPSDYNAKFARRDSSGRAGHIDLEGGLEITLHCEIDQRDPSGATTPYRMIVPALSYRKVEELVQQPAAGGLKSFFGSLRRGRSQQRAVAPEPQSGARQEQVSNEFAESGGRSNREIYGDAAALGLGLGAASQVNAGHGDFPVAQRQLPGSNARDTNAIDMARASAGDPAPENGLTSGVKPPSNVDGRYQRRHAHDLEHQASLRGPQAPRNISDLPLSVQKRYSQFGAGDDSEFADSGRHAAEQSIASRSNQASSLPKPTTQSNTANAAHPSMAQQQYQQSPWALPATGLSPPLGRVNNRFDLTPTEAEMREQEQLHQQRREATQRAQRELEATEKRRSSLPIDTSPFIAPALHRRSVRSRGGSQKQRSSQASQGTAEKDEGKVPARASTYHTPPTSAKQASPNQAAGQFPSPLSSAPVTERDVAHARTASQSSEQQNINDQRPVSHHESHAHEHEHERGAAQSDGDVSSIRSWSASPSPPPPDHDDPSHDEQHSDIENTHAAHGHEHESSPETTQKAGGFSKMVRKISGRS